MRKIICLAVVVLMIALVGCAGQKVAITQSNVPSLKGTWEGTLGYGFYEGASGPAKLEILNDTVPLKAKLTMNVPQIVATGFGIPAGNNVLENDNGKLTNAGTVLWTGADAAKASFEVSLKGEKSLNAWFFFKGMRGDGNFTKK
jgi:hypothetical protein